MATTYKGYEIEHKAGNTRIVTVEEFQALIRVSKGWSIKRKLTEMPKEKEDRPVVQKEMKADLKPEPKG